MGEAPFEFFDEPPTEPLAAEISASLTREGASREASSPPPPPPAPRAEGAAPEARRSAPEAQRSTPDAQRSTPDARPSAPDVPRSAPAQRDFGGASSPRDNAASPRPNAPSPRPTPSSPDASPFSPARAAAAPAQRLSTIETPTGPFSRMHYRFTTGLRAGETAHIRDESDKVLLSYRAFASATGVVAALVSGIVLVAGLAAVAFLLAENAPVRALLALVLTLVFSFVITLLVPRVNVTLYDDGNPALTITQRSVFPSATYLVSAPNGVMLALLRKSFFSRLGRNAWFITVEGRVIGEAREESFFRALLRKFLGKFSRAYETNLRLEQGSYEAGWITRRPAANAVIDSLTLTSDTIDRRVAVALATLILGREP